MFVCNNRNKRSLVLDLKSEAGRAVFTRLLRWAEVFVHNMRPAAIDRLGFGFAPVAAINPDIIYCAAVGFGRGGRYAGRPAFDDVIQAAGGIAALPSYRGQDPAYVPGVMADKVAALTATYGVMAAIAARGRGTKGPIEVEAAMFESVAAFVLNEHLAAAAFGGAPEAAGYHRMFAPDRRPYRTRDGWIAALPYTEQQWRRLLEFTGRHDVLAQPWFVDPGERSAHIAELYAVLAEEMARRATGEWLRALEDLDIPHARVNRLEDLLTDPHLQDVDFFAPNGSGLARSARQPVAFPGLPAQPDRPSPALGADNEEIARMLGYDAAGIDALRAAGAFGPPG
jgi:crotonobetainyl-CoA:carnitine CoA-transferase CaiB-like acyl-CoA transferase